MSAVLARAQVGADGHKATLPHEKVNDILFTVIERKHNGLTFTVLRHGQIRCEDEHDPV